MLLSAILPMRHEFQSRHRDRMSHGRRLTGGAEGRGKEIRVMLGRREPLDRTHNPFRAGIAIAALAVISGLVTGFCARQAKAARDDSKPAPATEQISAVTTH